MIWCRSQARDGLLRASLAERAYIPHALGRANVTRSCAPRNDAHFSCTSTLHHIQTSFYTRSVPLVKIFLLALQKPYTQKDALYSIGFFAKPILLEIYGNDSAITDTNILLEITIFKLSYKLMQKTSALRVSFFQVQSTLLDKYKIGDKINAKPMIDGMQNR